MINNSIELLNSSTQERNRREVDDLIVDVDDNLEALKFMTHGPAVLRMIGRIQDKVFRVYMLTLGVSYGFLRQQQPRPTAATEEEEEQKLKEA